MVLTELQMKNIDKSLNKEAEFNSRNSFGELSYTQINNIINRELENEI